MKSDRRLILERLQTTPGHITTTVTDIFSSNVPESKMRYIVKIYLMGDNSSARIVDLYLKKEDGSYELKIPMIHVSSAEITEIGSENPDNPILVLQGGSNLAGRVNAGTGISLAVIWWDDDR